MTSLHRGGPTHRARAHRWSHRGAEHSVEPQAPEPDPVHPQPRPASATAVAAEMRPEGGQRSRTEPGAGAGTATEHPNAPRMEPIRNRAEVEPTKHDPDSELAADHGTPAVLKHHVVALSVVPGGEPLRLCTEDGEYPLVPLQAQVWARAGRLTVVTQDGSEHKLTVLGPHECEGLRLGQHWPPGEPDSMAKRAAVAAAHDVGNVVTFPAWLNRTTRRSGERNAAMYALVRRLRQASPQTRVYFGQTVGFEHPSGEQHRPYDHRGPVGHEGYPTEL